LQEQEVVLEERPLPMLQAAQQVLEQVVVVQDHMLLEHFLILAQAQLNIFGLKLPTEHRPVQVEVEEEIQQVTAAAEQIMEEAAEVLMELLITL
jgi:hypothetical protein